LLLFVTTYKHLYTEQHVSSPHMLRIDLDSLIPKKVSNIKSSFQQLHDVAGLTTETPDTTTPKHTSNTPEPSAAHDYAVYVEVLDEEVSNCI